MTPRERAVAFLCVLALLALVAAWGAFLTADTPTEPQPVRSAYAPFTVELQLRDR